MSAGPGAPVPGSPPAGSPRPWPRRRDRRGRGLRGHLLPPHLPGHRSPADRFDDLVLDSVERLSRRWERELAAVDVAVEDVPAGDPASGSPVPTGRAEPAGPGRRARLVLHRRPLVDRSGDDLARAVHVAVVEQLASLLARTPEEIDPELAGDGD